jgi:AcrR family transcriptional regulator
MNKPIKDVTLSAPEKILGAASELFYKQGYRATGINEVIKQSGVAKATFYSHFPTKDDLCVSYLEDLGGYYLERMDSLIQSTKGPVKRFMAVMGMLEPWLKGTDFRGCGFMNMASEIPDHNNQIRKVGVRFYEGVRERVRVLSQELVNSNPNKYGKLDAQVLCDNYMVIFAGAIALAEIYHDIWPLERGINALQRMIGQ